MKTNDHFIFGVIFSAFFALAFSSPVALNGALKVRMGEGQFFSLNATGTGDADWVIVSLPKNGTLFHARRSSGLMIRLHSIQFAGTRSLEGLFFYSALID